MNKLIVVGLLCLVLVEGCVSPPSRYREDLFGGNFTYSGDPKLGQEFEVVFHVEPLVTFTDSNISVAIPAGLELIEGNTSYLGGLKGPERVNNQTKRDQIELKMKLKAVEEGKHQIEVTAQGSFEGRSGSVDELMHYWLFITSSKDSGEFSRKVPRELWPQVRTQLQKSPERE